MAESQEISPLKAKRAEISGKMQKIDERRLALRERLAHLDAALRLFCYAGDPAQIKPKRKRQWMFRHVQLKRMVLDIEREATAPLHKDEIALGSSSGKAGRQTQNLVETMAETVKDARKRLTEKKSAHIPQRYVMDGD